MPHGFEHKPIHWESSIVTIRPLPLIRRLTFSLHLLSNQKYIQISWASTLLSCTKHLPSFLQKLEAFEKEAKQILLFFRKSELLAKYTKFTT